MARSQIILAHHRAPGDIVTMTALARDIALQHSDKFEVLIDSSCSEIWENNPHVHWTKFGSPPKIPSGARYIKLSYGKGIRDQKHETIHFLNYWHRDFQLQTKVPVKLTHPWPDLHLSAEEAGSSPVEGRYWVFLSGGKSDFTTKVWHHTAWAATINGLRDMGIKFVQLGGKDKGHWHPKVPGVLNLVGQTSLRDMIRIIKHADGVICGVTCAAHIAAALHKPCVVIAGGREAWWWEAYVPENHGLGGAAVASQIRVPHRFLHTIGLLDCVHHNGGCWRNKVVPLHDDKLLCKKPVILPGQAVPLCLQMITPSHVQQAVVSYYYDGTLSPIPGTRIEEDLKAMSAMQKTSLSCPIS